MASKEETGEGRRPSSLFAEEDFKSRPKVAPRVITGPAHMHNQGAIDWGENGLLAFGCNYSVMIVDTRNIQPIQSLDKHKSMVTKVLWGLGQKKKLVSADTSGHIIIWNIQSGNSKAVVQDGKNPVASMAWLSGYDDGDHLLLTLHPPNALTLWDTQKYTKIWKKTYTENLVAFDLNPFEANKLAFQCSDCILFVEDLLPSKVPSSNGRKFYVSTPKPCSNPRSLSSGSLSAGGVEEKHGTRDRLRRLMRDLVVGETKPKAEDSVPVMECLQLVHHRAVRNLLLLVYPSEILILDLHINHTVGLIPLDRSTSPLLQVVSARQRDVLYCLHESGSVSVRAHRQQPLFVGSPLDAPSGSVGSLDKETGIIGSDPYLEVTYEQRCQSEVIRQTKGSKIIGIACSRICERRLALFVNTGKIVFLELQPSNTGTNMYANLGSQSSALKSSVPKETLSDLVPSLASESVAVPLRLLLMGLLPAVISPITAMKMNVCDVRKSADRLWSLSGPLLAVGTSNGLVQIISATTGSIEKEIAVSSYPIRGIEWINQYSIITWSHPNISGSSATVRNELCITDISTGFIQHLRQDRGDECPIEIVRVSPLRLYFAVVLKDGILEVWDLLNLTSVRHWNTKKITTIVALEWSPLIVRRVPRKKSMQDIKDERRASQASVPSTPISADVVGAFGSCADLASEAEDFKDNQITCERFALIDGENNFYQFLQDGNVARDGVKVLPESGKAATSCLAMKDKFIIQGDVEGNLFVWDLKTHQNSTIPTNRGGIKKMCFAPGHENFKLLLLFNDGVLLLNPSESLTHAVELRCPRDMVSIVDVDWASDVCPLFATQDGCLRVMDSKLKHYCSSSITEYEFQDHVSCVALLPKNVRRNLQTILATQYWEQDTIASVEEIPPSWLKLSTENGFTEPQLIALREQLSQVDSGVLAVLSKPGATSGVAERCLLLSRFFGDQFDIDFWTIALHYLEIARAELKYRNTESGGTVPDIFNAGLGSAPIHEKRMNLYPNIIPLDTCYDVLCDSHSYRCQQIDRVTLYESKRGDYQHTKRVIQELILLGETDRAVQLLLETELENSNYYTDAIKACLVATIQSTGAAQSTIKLVATNLIANGNIWEGVQLLCLIGKGLDACRYLLSYNLWNSAVWLAKSVLSPLEMNEVLKKWSDYLLATGHKNQALLVILSMGNFERALEVLGSFRLHMHAGLLLQACREFGVLPQRREMDLSSPQTALLNAVELDFARCLFNTGNHRGGLLVCRHLGESGKELRREFEILAEESI